ncbi:hypothetical protein GQ42DRAFT_164415 [Ramicandelaber brevisporus]|nr:hypothetical protein GQ42DRAFT_164415 [Ramicandelaber brevisporus]
MCGTSKNNIRVYPQLILRISSDNPKDGRAFAICLVMSLTKVSECGALHRALAMIENQPGLWKAINAH